MTGKLRYIVKWKFITLICIFSFSSVTLGLPKHIRDDDVHCEYPVDADDEYVTERGFQPTLPGESTKLSAALALFKASRILSKVLEEVYPAKASYDLSLKKLSDLSDELTPGTLHFLTIYDCHSPRTSQPWAPSVAVRPSSP